MSEKNTLVETEIVTERIGRRSSIVALIGGSVAAAVGLVAGTPSKAEAQCTDSDGGPHADPGGHGRRCGHHCSDSDGGHHADPAGGGRHCGGGGHRCTDSDGGRYADPAGRGRHC